MTSHQWDADDRDTEGAPSRPAEAICHQHLEKVAHSVTFSRAEQLRKLLRWLGERSLTPSAVSPSEKEIAECVLHRLDFDPQTDSLVRKEMSRLREKLSRYYQSEGLRDPVAISAQGGYLFQFESRGNFDPLHDQCCWLVLPFRTSRDAAELAIETLEELLMSISEQGGPQLVSPAMALAYRERPGDLRQFAAECRANFVVEGSLRVKGQEFEAIVWLVDGQNGRTRRSRRVNGSTPAALATNIAGWLLQGETGTQSMHAF